MSENERCVTGKRRQAIKKLKLDSGAGKPFDTVDPGRMEEDVLRGFRSKPADVNTQGVSGRRTGGQFQCMEPAARFL